MQVNRGHTLPIHHSYIGCTLPKRKQDMPSTLLVLIQITCWLNATHTMARLQPRQHRRQPPIGARPLLRPRAASPQPRALPRAPPARTSACSPGPRPPARIALLTLRSAASRRAPSSACRLHRRTFGSAACWPRALGGWAGSASRCCPVLGPRNTTTFPFREKLSCKKS